MTPKELEYFKLLSEENKSTQKALSEIRNMLSQFIKEQKTKHRENVW